jgi:hypothetical protein
MVKRETFNTTFSGFAFWFARYSHLVQDLSLDTPENEEGRTCKVAETMICLAFSKAAASGKPPGLQSFKATGKLIGSAMLSSLPHRSIKSLDLSINTTQMLAPSLPRNLQLFSNLQTLVLGVSGSANVPCLPPGFMHNSFSELSSLKHVHFSFYNCGWPSLKGLPRTVQSISARADGAKCLLDIQHLTSLRALDVHAREGIVEGFSLPSPLLSATLLDTPLPVDACSWLSGLEQLTLHPSFHEGPFGPLQQLSGLKGLQELSLLYPNLKKAAAGSAAWGSLPQLRFLQVWDDGGGTSLDYFIVVKDMAKATRLTSLELSLSSSRPKLPCAM